MGTNLVVVALPDENDRVWKTSSEKKPHLTLLFLGETEQVDNLDTIMQFIEHAANTSLKRFYLTVDRRGELGDDKADVLFFKKSRYDFKAVRDFRAMLLQDPNIRTAYDSAEQFEGWTPHLTLGYPEAPAKPLPNDFGDSYYSVDFNRIAVWTGDFEGPEFLLKDYWDEMEAIDAIPMDVAMSDIQHHGVKGMKWGVRKVDNGGEIRINQKTGMAAPSQSSTVALVGTAMIMPPVIPALFLSKKFRSEIKATREHNKQVQADKKDAKDLQAFEKRVKSAEGFSAIHNGAVPQFNREIAKLNAKPEYQGNLYENPAAKKAYDAEALKTLQDAYRASANSLMNKKLTHHVDLEFVNDGADFKIHVKPGMGKPVVEHVATTIDDETFEGKIVRTTSGHIYSLEFNDFGGSSMAQTADLGAEFISHHGVKGMRWGVRKQDVASAAKSTGGKVGSAARATGRFVSDVAFEANTNPRKDKEGNEIASVARERVIREASKDFGSKDLPAIRSKPEYQKAIKLRNRLLHPRDPATRAYRQEVKNAYINRLETTANSMKNASGTREYSIRERGGDLPSTKYYWEVSTREARHAESADFTLVEVLMDDDGFITGTKTVTEDDVAQHIAELGEEFISHYGVKGMRWGVRKQNEQRTSMWDPEGHDKTTDLIKGYIWPAIPPLGLFAIPAQVRLVRAAGRGTKAKLTDVEEKRFAKKAQSEKNFVEIHNRSGERFNREIDAINAKHPGDLTKDPKAQKRYDDDVLKLMQDSYREAANSIGNRSNTMHLDLEFRNDGMDFAIKAREGVATPLPNRVKHAAEDDTSFTLTGKIKRDATGHIIGFEFDGTQQAMAQTADLGAAFLSHYGVKGMRWGVTRTSLSEGMARRQAQVESQRREKRPAADVKVTDTIGTSKRQKTKIATKGGEDHPATEDAIKVAAAQQKLKKSGIHALTNDELQQVERRLNLEQNVARLTGQKKTFAGKKFVDQHLTNNPKNQKKIFDFGLAQVTKKAAKAGAAAAL